MYRALFTWPCLLLPLIAMTCGCGGGGESDVEFAQAPASSAPVVVTPSGGDSAAPSGDSETMGAGQEAGSEAEPGAEDMADAGNAGMGGYGPPDMNYGGAPQGMGGMGMGMVAPPEDPSMGYEAMGSMPMGMSADSSSMMGMGGMGSMMGMGQNAMPEPDPTPDEDADYLTKAKYAFAVGKEKEAIEYALAHAIASDDGTEIFQKTRWLAPALPVPASEADKKAAKPKSSPKPATTARFAVGIILEAPANATDLRPIGSKQLQGGGSGSMSGMGSSGETNNAKNSKERALYDVTGTFGQAIVEAFEERWSAGKLGSVFNEVTPIKPKRPGANNNSMMGMGSMMGSMGSMGSMMSPDSGGESMDMSAMGSMGGMPGSTQNTAPKVLPGSIVTPGLIYVGSVADKQKQAELMKKAEEYGVDGIFIFDVTVSAPNRLNGVVQNEARVRLMSMKGELLARSSELLNTKVERALNSSAGEDEVAKAVEKFFVQFDDRFKMADLPPIKPEQAKSRVIQILTNPEYSKLHKLYEIGLYHSLKLISDEDQTKAYLIVMQGSEGEALAKGSALDKQLVLDPMLPAYK